MSIVMDWIVPFIVGAITGVLSGFGVGGGTLLLLYLTTVAGTEQHLAQGINLLYFLPAGLLALPSHWNNGYIVKEALLPCIVAGLLCAALGAWVATGLDTQLLHRCFGVFLVFIGISQCFEHVDNH